MTQEYCSLCGRILDEEGDCSVFCKGNKDRQREREEEREA